MKSSSPRSETMMIGVLRVARMRRQTSNPCIPGRLPRAAPGRTVRRASARALPGRRPRGVPASIRLTGHGARAARTKAERLPCLDGERVQGQPPAAGVDELREAVVGGVRVAVGAGTRIDP